MKHILTLSLLLSFYLGLYNNHLAIFDSERSYPVITLPYCADLYPEEDQKRLRSGIEFNTSNELSRLLEDFIS